MYHGVAKNSEIVSYALEPGGNILVLPIRLAVVLYSRGKTTHFTTVSGVQKVLTPPGFFSEIERNE
jgi:hypothetical protein